MPYHPKVLPALVFAVGSLVSPWAAAQLGETFWRPLVTEHQWVDLAQPRLIDGVAVALNGPQYVRYGADKRWVYRTMQGAFTCNNNMFNAFNEARVTGRNTTVNYSSPADPNTPLNLPFDSNGNLLPNRVRPNQAGFGAVTGYQAPRTIQAYIRFGF